MLITLKNGQREFENGMTPLEIAGQLSQELKKQALCARVDGKIVELWQPIDHDCELEILTFEDDDGQAGAAPHRQPRAGSGREAAASRGQAGHRPRHRQRLLLRL